MVIKMSRGHSGCKELANHSTHSTRSTRARRNNWRFLAPQFTPFPPLANNVQFAVNLTNSVIASKIRKEKEVINLELKMGEARP